MKKRLDHHKKLRGESIAPAVDVSIYKRQIEAIKRNASVDKPIWDVSFPLGSSDNSTNKK